MRILIAEDEEIIGKALKVMLEKNNYTVDWVTRGDDALGYLMRGGYDAAVLDIMMPGMSGIDVLRSARARGVATPTLFLTAKSEVEDRVAGLDAGADDYLPKPFASSEFLARVRALTRRGQAYAPSLLCVGSTTLDRSEYLLRCAGNSQRLNNKEYQLMELFMRNPHHVFSTEHILEKLWSWDSETGIDVVWTYIGFLRKRLKAVCADVEIKTIRGAGYALEEITDA